MHRELYPWGKKSRTVSQSVQLRETTQQQYDSNNIINRVSIVIGSIATAVYSTVRGALRVRGVASRSKHCSQRKSIKAMAVQYTAHHSATYRASQTINTHIIDSLYVLHTTVVEYRTTSNTADNFVVIEVSQPRQVEVLVKQQ